MHEIKAIIRPDRLETVIHPLREIPDLPGINKLCRLSPALAGANQAMCMGLSNSVKWP